MSVLLSQMVVVMLLFSLGGFIWDEVGLSGKKFEASSGV